jgi:hypothetical protein
MGGKAFKNHATASGKPAQVPRLPLELYQVIAAQCQSKLESLFDRVVIPRDAPAKKDFGDIDFLASGIKSAVCSRKEIWATIKDVLGAELHFAGGFSHSYGIPHPSVPDAYVQVDVELSPGDGTPDGPELFEWIRFMQSDSDLLQIVGVSHRSLGLTCTDQGLQVRIADIEPYNKKKALLFLTRDPNKAMEFYGFDTAKYWTGFTDETDLFDWVTSGRFFSSSIFASRVEKSNDRSRQAKRPMYARFVEEYMPDHSEKGASNVWTREEVLEEAVNFFKKRAEYDAMMEERRVKEAEDQLWAKIRMALPLEGTSLGFAMKSLRRWVAFHDGEPQITDVPIIDDQPPWIESMKAGTTQTLLHWVKGHWQETKALEKARAAASKEAGQQK